MPLDYVLYDISYANIVMLGATLPSIKSHKQRNGASAAEAAGKDVIDAEDPKNRERVKKFFQSVD